MGPLGETPARSSSDRPPALGDTGQYFLIVGSVVAVIAGVGYLIYDKTFSRKKNPFSP